MEEVTVSGTGDFVVPALSDIPSAGMSKIYEGNFDSISLCVGPFTVRVEEGSKYAIKLDNTGSGIVASGPIECTVLTQCARCLEDARIAINEEVEGFFIRENETRPEDMAEDEVEFLSVQGEADLFTCIASTLVYAFPQDPLCKDDCKGLCPKCGANLNEESCECANEPDPLSPFAALKDLNL